MRQEELWAELGTVLEALQQVNDARSQTADPNMLHTWDYVIRALNKRRNAVAARIIELDSRQED